MTLFIMQFSPASHLGMNILLSILFSNTLCMFFPSCQIPSLTPTQNIM